jgi:arylsulfatase A-like enzyme
MKCIWHIGLWLHISLTTILLHFSCNAAANGKPNVLFILADDFRPDCIAALGNPNIKTPHLDQLAARGMSFSHAYTMGSMVGAVCTPSRTMILTGRSFFNAPGTNYALWPKAMAAGGYETFHLGKKGNSFVPGMEAFETCLYSGDLGADKNHEIASEKTADRVIEFLQGRQTSKPFFIYYAPPVPHDPRIAPKQFMDLYDPKKIPIPVRFKPLHSFNNGEMTVRDEMLAPFPRTEAIVQKHLADYYASVTCLDHHIGRIIDTLKEKNLFENTIIIFTGDNGLSLGDHGLFGKQNLYEMGGMHVPLIMAGPNIPHGRTEALIYLYDIFPTVCALTKTAIPTQVDGKDQTRVLKGEASIRKNIFTLYKDAQRSIRDDRWKLIRYPQINYDQLFDLKTDPYELHNLAENTRYKDKLKEMTSLMKKAQKEVGDRCLLESVNPQNREWSPPPSKQQERKSGDKS